MSTHLNVSSTFQNWFINISWKICCFKTPVQGLLSGNIFKMASLCICINIIHTVNYRAKSTGIFSKYQAVLKKMLTLHQTKAETHTFKGSKTKLLNTKEQLNLYIKEAPHMHVTQDRRVKEFNLVIFSSHTMSFQICMFFFLTWNTTEDTLKNVHIMKVSKVCCFVQQWTKTLYG